MSSGPNAGTPVKLTWNAGAGVPSRFQLQFHAVPLEGEHGGPSTPFWPFEEPAPANGIGLTEPAEQLHVHADKRELRM